MLAHILGRADPWATARTCGDRNCDTCRSKVWLQEQKKACRKDNTELPAVLLQKTAYQCTREGVNYSLQCLDCALEGEVRESVQISEMPEGLTRLNRCQEWGAPRVPVLSAQGGDGPEVVLPSKNPRPEWTQRILSEIADGGCKILRYWTESEDDSVNNDVGNKLGPDHDDDVDVDTNEVGSNPEEQPAPRKRRRVQVLNNVITLEDETNVHPPDAGLGLVGDVVDAPLPLQHQELVHHLPVVLVQPKHQHQEMDKKIQL